MILSLQAVLDHLDQLAPRADQDHKVPTETTDLKDQMDLRVQMATQAQEDQLDQRVVKETTVILVHKVVKVEQVPQDQMVAEEIQDRKDLKGTLDQTDQQDDKETMEILDHRDQQVHGDQVEILDLKVGYGVMNISWIKSDI